MPADLPGPIPTPDAGPYWDAANEERLTLQRCAACGTHRFFPRPLCPECGADAVDWIDASGDGIVHSFTIVHRAPTPAFRAHVPYVVALIDLVEGPRMMTNIIGADAGTVAIGDRVQVCFEARGPDAKVPQFRKITG